MQDLKTVSQSPSRPGSDGGAPGAGGHRIQAGGLVPLGYAAEPMVNSSHHQAIRAPGDNLLVSAVSPADMVVEAVELDSDEHFVVGVQWHPERTYTHSAFSRAIFAAFVQAASRSGSRDGLKSRSRRHDRRRGDYRGAAERSSA